MGNDSRIESAEQNVTVSLSSLGNTTDANLGTDAAFLLDGRTMTNFYGTHVLQAYVQQTALSKIQVDQVRDISTGAGTRIAGIETGVDPNHPALRSWLDPGVDVLLPQHLGTRWVVYGCRISVTYAAFLLDHRFLFLLNRILSSYEQRQHDDRSTLGIWTWNVGSGSPSRRRSQRPHRTDQSL